VIVQRDLTMAFVDELRRRVKEIFVEQWETRNGTVVPEAEDVGLGNEAVKLEGTVLYADLADSTMLVEKETASFAAEIYKNYLHCASKIIENEGGVITAFDGDRVMAVFIGDYKNTAAARCALKINYAIQEIINPAIIAQYPTQAYRVRQVVGVDSSSLFVARTGVRGANDLVWVGRSANYAAKLSSLNEPGFSSYITARVYDKMNDEAKFSSTNGRSMWESRTWKGITVYRSEWTWTV
jgi:class 3 adenylate cyclase